MSRSNVSSKKRAVASARVWPEPWGRKWCQKQTGGRSAAPQTENAGGGLGGRRARAGRGASDLIGILAQAVAAAAGGTGDTGWLGWKEQSGWGSERRACAVVDEATGGLLELAAEEGGGGGAEAPEEGVDAAEEGAAGDRDPLQGSGDVRALGGVDGRPVEAGK